MCAIMSSERFSRFVEILYLFSRQRRRRCGDADYSYLIDHIVILGWQGMDA